MNRLGKKSAYQIGQPVYLNLKEEGNDWEKINGLTFGVITEIDFSYTNERFYYSVKISYHNGEKDTEKIICGIKEREVNPDIFQMSHILLEQFLRNTKL